MNLIHSPSSLDANIILWIINKKVIYTINDSFPSGILSHCVIYKNYFQNNLFYKSKESYKIKNLKANSQLTGFWVFLQSNFNNLTSSQPVDFLLHDFDLFQQVQDYGRPAEVDAQAAAQALQF